MMNKRKIIAILTVIAITGTLLLLFTRISDQSIRKKEIAKELETIPSFEFFQLNGKPFTQDSIQKQLPAVFIYFHTDCDFCGHEAESIAKNLSDFNNTQLLFISSEHADSILTFAAKRELSNKPNALFLQDKKLIFPVRFDVNSAPYTLVYDKNGKLLRRFNGQILAPAILKVLNEDEKE